jgi:hypothetical protein
MALLFRGNFAYRVTPYTDTPAAACAIKMLDDAARDILERALDAKNRRCLAVFRKGLKLEHMVLSSRVDAADISGELRSAVWDNFVDVMDASDLKLDVPAKIRFKSK